MTLEDYVRDKTLFKAYPELRGVKVEIIDDPASSRGSVIGDTICINRDYCTTTEEVRGTLIHEVQHVIQGIDGFASGGDLMDVEQSI